MDNQEPKGGLHDLKVTSNCVVSVCQILAITVEVFLHRGFGERYLGLSAALAIPMILIFSMFFPPSTIGPLFSFLMFYLIMCVVARIGVLYRSWFGKETIHSRYTGSPYLMLLFPRWREITVKRIEAVMVLGAGYAIYRDSVALGAYLMTAALGMFLSLFFSEVYSRSRAQDMKDAVIDQTLITERFRKMQDR